MSHVSSGTACTISPVQISVRPPQYPAACFIDVNAVRALAFRFEAFGRPIKSTKKWEEGVFSDLRNLKPGTDACLEEPK